MKIQNLAALLVATLLICGCSTTKFTEYHGSEVFQGKGGGAVSNVDGIDIWEDGDADRKYKILGLIEQSRGERLPFGRFFRIFSSPGDRDSTIANAAHMPTLERPDLCNPAIERFLLACSRAE